MRPTHSRKARWPGDCPLCRGTWMHLACFRDRYQNPSKEDPVTTIAEAGKPWLVVAAPCDCGKIAITIMNADVCDPDASADAEGPHEFVLAGTDWREMVAAAAAAMSALTGLPVSGCCTTVATRDQDLKQQVRDQVTEMLYAMDGPAPDPQDAA